MGKYIMEDKKIQQQQKSAKTKNNKLAG